MNKTIKILGIFFVICMVSFTMVSCGDKEGSKSDGKLTLAFNEDSVGNLNPHAYLPNQFVTQDMVYEGLVAYGEGGEIKPALAESWDVKNGGKTYVFHLRKGVKFSDGSDFDADNVVKNFDTIFSKTNKTNHTWFALTNYLTGYKAIDKDTFELDLANPYSATLYDLAMIRPIRFLATTAFPKDGDTMKGIKAPIGTGPWVLKEHKNNEYAVFVPNKYYWGEKPKAKEVVIKVVPDAETLALQFESGDIDLIYGNSLISLDRFNTYKKDDKYVTKTSDPMSTRMVLFNTNNKIFKDVNVRRALQHAVDKKSVAKNIFGDVEKPADTIFGPNVPNTNIPLKKYDFNISLAEKMLDDNGWKKGKDGIRAKNGVKMEITLPYISSKVADKNVVEYLQSQWNKIGLKVNVKAKGEKQYWEDAKKGDFDAIMEFSWGAPWDPHAYLTAMTKDGSGGGPTYIAQQGLPMKDKLEKTIEQLLVESNKDKLKDEYKYVLETLNDQAVYLPITYQVLELVYRNGEFDDVKFMPEENRLPVFDTVKK